jgi:hypothetical protein
VPDDFCFYGYWAGVWVSLLINFCNILFDANGIFSFQ